ncbi:arf-GAP with coiled-coil, ANK repeat and PH domain-containing protein 2-like isoform X2 [Corticium candelabrum]|nr:arf-GAP with coiled-coil, ANK repeat and PH domain-containing protein 2-like isoform X2 [Corticium candelabrum]
MALNRELAALLEETTIHDLDPDDADMLEMMESFVSVVQQVEEHRERVLDQRRIGVVQPLESFLKTDVLALKDLMCAFRKANSNADTATQKLCQCKRNDVVLLSEASIQLHEARRIQHRTSCQYIIEMNALHEKKRPELLERVVELLTCEASFHKLCQLQLQEVEGMVGRLFTQTQQIKMMQEEQKKIEESNAKRITEEVEAARARDLVIFQTYDLHLSPSTTEANNSMLQAVVGIAPPLVHNGSPVEKPLVTMKSGYLLRGEPRLPFGMTFVRQYFHIIDGLLLSQRVGRNQPQLEVNLKLCTVKHATAQETERNFCFRVISPNKTLFLQGESSHEVESWITALQNATAHAILSQQTVCEEDKNLTVPRRKIPQSHSSPDITSISTDNAESQHLSLSPFSAFTTSATDTVDDIWSVPGNEICADCEKAKPKWASVVVGVTLCIDCSGVHRSLGVDISQVKSLTLDTLKPEWIDKLKRVGNRTANELFEYELPSDFSKNFKNQDERRHFIRQKYDELTFMTKSNREAEQTRRRDVLETKRQAQAAERSHRRYASADQLLDCIPKSSVESSAQHVKDRRGSLQTSKDEISMLTSDSVAGPSVQKASSRHSGGVFGRIGQSLRTVKNAMMEYTKNEF